MAPLKVIIPSRFFKNATLLNEFTMKIAAKNIHEYRATTIKNDL